MSNLDARDFTCDTFVMDFVDAGDTIDQTAYCQDLAQIMNTVISLLSLGENLFSLKTYFYEGGVNR